MSTHQDSRTSTQFPPPGFTGQPVAPHMAGDTTGWEPQPVAQAQPSIGAGYSTGDPQPPAEEENYGYEDYYGFSEVHRFMMPDRRQWIEFKTLAEGDLMRYHARLNRDVMVEKTTGNARIRMNQVEERNALLMVAITGWHLVRRDRSGQFREVPFNNKRDGELEQWLKVANPAIIADLDKAIRDQNPFLLSANTETVEAIDKQIAELEDQKAKLLERMQGEADSAAS